jgi:D-amino-acid oxidase
MSGAIEALLPTPDFTWDSTARPPIAGLRPYRDQTYRLEPEVVGDKFVVHNYGHGGAGITLSWGCALEVVDIIAHRGFTAGQRVAVLGSGVMGLTAATCLKGLNYDVTIYAKSFPPNTTSNVAGGQWAPSMVNHADSNQFTRVLRRSFATHRSKGAPFGVSPRLNYTLVRAENFESCPRDVIPPPKNYAHLPFAHLRSSGFSYATLLVEPPIFLNRLSQDLNTAGVRSVQREFKDMSEFSGLSEPIIVNCTGLGAKTICRDQLMHPIKGQLVLLPPQPNLQYLFAGHHGYMFPRQDCVVIGGSEEVDVSDPTPDMKICRAILANMRALFTGAPQMALESGPIPSWAMKSK